MEELILSYALQGQIWTMFQPSSHEIVQWLPRAKMSQISENL